MSYECRISKKASYGCMNGYVITSGCQIEIISKAGPESDLESV